jgi:hypothetical protein
MDKLERNLKFITKELNKTYRDLYIEQVNTNEKLFILCEELIHKYHIAEKTLFMSLYKEEKAIEKMCILDEEIQQYENDLSKLKGGEVKKCFTCRYDGNSEGLICIECVDSSNYKED